MRNGNAFPHLSVFFSHHRRETEDGLEEVAVDGERHLPTLQLRQALRDGEAEAVSLGRARAVAAHKALHQFLGGNVQRRARGVLEGHDRVAAGLFKRQINARAILRVFADVREQIVDHAPHQRAVHIAEELLVRHHAHERQVRRAQLVAVLALDLR